MRKTEKEKDVLRVRMVAMSVEDYILNTCWVGS